MGESVILIQNIQFRRNQLATQLQEIGFQLSRTAQQLEALKTQEVATKGAIAGLDEILSTPDTYGKPTSMVDTQVPPKEQMVQV